MFKQVLDKVTLHLCDRDTRTFHTAVRRRRRHGLRNAPSRNTDCGCVTLNIPENNRVSSYLHIVSERDVAQNARTRANETSVAQRWMPLSSFLTCAAKSHVLVDSAVIPDNSSFSDDYPHSVVDE